MMSQKELNPAATIAANTSFLHHSFCSVISTVMCFYSTLLVSFSLYYGQQGREQQQNPTEHGVSCRDTGAVSMT